jgi:murein DD-endopeptidase MepM/ murein hydrolase activator NlpD
MRRSASVKWHASELARELWGALCDALARGYRKVAEAAALGPRELFRLAGQLALRVAGALAFSAVAFVLIGALVAAHRPGAFERAVLTVAAAVIAPLLVCRLPWVRERRFVVAVWNGAMVMILVIACGRDLGGALRRHGDWFLQQRSDPGAMRMRAAISGTAALLEWFRPPVELRSHELDPAEAPPYYGPWRPDETPYPPEPVRVRWVHPLQAAPRTLPAFESRRFGAVRPQPRPWECELGHCGVDLAAPLGQPVVAVADGVVERIERSAAAGGRAGRYVRLGHLGGAVVTRYLHLDRVRSGLRPGQRVVAGELIGTVGRTGVEDNFPHLHFGLSKRTPDGDRYLDPEPLLGIWELYQDRPQSARPPSVIALN